MTDRIVKGITDKLYATEPDPFFKVPEAVVVDAHDGYVFWRDADAVLFTAETAREFAEHRNSEMKPEHRKFIVRLLAEPPEAETPRGTHRRYPQGKRPAEYRPEPRIGGNWAPRGRRLWTWLTGSSRTRTAT